MYNPKCRSWMTEYATQNPSETQNRNLLFGSDNSETVTQMLLLPRSNKETKKRNRHSGKFSIEWQHESSKAKMLHCNSYSKICNSKALHRMHHIRICAKEKYLQLELWSRQCKTQDLMVKDECTYFNCEYRNQYTVQPIIKSQLEKWNTENIDCITPGKGIQSWAEDESGNCKAKAA